MSLLDSRRLTKLLTVATLTFAVLAALSPAAAWVLDRAYGQDVLPVAKASPEAVRANEALWEEGDPVAEIYGVPGERKMRVVFVDADRIVTPRQDRSLHLLLIDKQRGDNPLQAKTLYFVAWRALAGLLGAAALSLGLLLWLRRRQRRRAAAGPARGTERPASAV